MSLSITLIQLSLLLDYTTIITVKITRTIVVHSQSKYDCTLVFALFLLTVGLFIPFSSFAYEEVALINGWESHTGDRNWEKITDSRNPPVKNDYKGGHLYLRIKLPSNTMDEPHLFVYGIYGQFDVFLDSEKIYTYSAKDPSSMSLYYPYYYHFIPLGSNVTGKTLEFVITSKYPLIGFQSTVLLNNRSGFVKHLLLSDLDRIVTLFIFLLTGILLLIHYAKSKRTLLLQAGIFSLAATLLSFNFTLIKQLWLDWPLFWSYFSQLNALIMAIVFFAIAEEITGGNLLIRSIWQLLLISGIIIAMAGLIVPIFVLVFAIYLFLIVGLLIVLVILAQQGNRDSRVFFVGLSVFIAFIVYDILIQLGWVSWGRSIGHWGFLTFIGFFITILWNREKKTPMLNLFQISIRYALSCSSTGKFIGIFANKR